MTALPGNYAIHARAIAEQYAARTIAEVRQPIVEIEARDLREGDEIVLDSGARVHTVRAVEAQPRKNLARIWTTTGDVITYSGLVLVTRLVEV